MTQDTRIIERYTDQPAQMPADLRRRIEDRWDGAPVQLYALADLDESMSLTRRWFALGPTKASTASQRDDGSWRIDSFERRDVEAVREIPGLSSTVLLILGPAGEAPLATLRYTHRQRRAMENLRFILEAQIEGRETAPADADRGVRAQRRGARARSAGAGRRQQAGRAVAAPVLPGSVQGAACWPVSRLPRSSPS